jgi:hypothetical protein
MNLYNDVPEEIRKAVEEVSSICYDEEEECWMVDGGPIGFGYEWLNVFEWQLSKEEAYATGLLLLVLAHKAKED